MENLSYLNWPKYIYLCKFEGTYQSSGRVSVNARIPTVHYLKEFLRLCLLPFFVHGVEEHDRQLHSHDDEQPGEAHT